MNLVSLLLTSLKVKREMTYLKRTNGLFTIGKRLIERFEMTYLALVNDLISKRLRVYTLHNKKAVTAD